MANRIEARWGVPIPLPSPREWGRLWRAIARADVVHLHDFAYPFHLGAALFCLVQRKPFLITQHIGAVPFRSVGLRFVLQSLNRTAGRFVLERATRVVFISDAVRRYFQDFASIGALTVPNGVDESLFSPLATPQRAQLRRELAGTLKIDAARPWLLFVGRFVEKKGVPLLVELSRQMPGAAWIFAGRGPLDPLALSASEKATNHVRVVRDRSGASLAELYRSADLLVLPSRGEGFPLVVQEALACGTPVLVGDELENALPGAAALLECEPVGEVDDLERWKARIEQILTRWESQTTRFARAAQARELWNWNHSARQYLALFERCGPRNRAAKAVRGQGDH